jgi:succinate dehydrogenase / fumarate reductase cytochrome b subunit
MLPDILFLTALSTLGAGIIAFSGYVIWAGYRRTAGGNSAPSSFRGLMQTMELAPTSAAAGGRVAFYLHRLSGVGVLVFLALHIVDVSLDAFSAGLYAHVHRLYSTPELRVLECGLIFAVLFHTMNGLRLLATDVLPVSPSTSRHLLVPVTAITLAGGVAASVVILLPVL